MDQITDTQKVGHSPPRCCHFRLSTGHGNRRTDRLGFGHALTIELDHSAGQATGRWYVTLKKVLSAMHDGNPPIFHGVRL